MAAAKKTAKKTAKKAAKKIVRKAAGKGPVVWELTGYWLVKSEPDVYSWGDLAREKRTTWDGVNNPTALMHLRSMKVGDGVVVYHSGDERQAVGVARVVKAAFADPKLDDPKRVVVDLAPDHALARPLTLTELKARPAWEQSALVRISRLSVMPLTKAQWDDLHALADRARP